jgi:hypothetical protein
MTPCLRFVPSVPAALALVLCAAGCGSSPPTSHDERPGSAPAAQQDARPMPDAMLPWTDAFQKSAVLLANDVRIEGPQGLIAHVATVSNPELLDRVEKATPEGFLQVVRLKEGVHGVEIKAQLDRLTIVALERLTVLEHPGATTVVVDAKGEVFWQDLDSKAEKRGEALRLEGKVPR